MAYDPTLGLGELQRELKPSGAPVAQSDYALYLS
jgi:hypothetical protein